MNCDLWRSQLHTAESLLTGLVFTFHCACVVGRNFVSVICTL